MDLHDVSFEIGKFNLEVNFPNRISKARVRNEPDPLSYVGNNIKMKEIPISLSPFDGNIISNFDTQVFLLLKEFHE